MSKTTILLAGVATAALIGLSGPAAAADDCTLNVARILPQTGALAVASLVHPWIDQHKVDQVNAAGGLKVGDKHCKVAFKLYDSKSTAAGSGDAATKAIVDDGAGVVLAAFTPETTNAPTEACERYDAVCITAITPVEAWMLGPDGKPQNRKTSFHMFFSVPDLVKNHVGMVKALPGGFNGKIGYLYPNGPDGIVFQSLFDPAFRKEGWSPVDPGRFAENSPDLSAVAKSFKDGGVEVVAGVLEPPALITFLKAAAAAGFSPKMYLIDKASGFTEAMQAIGPGGDGISGVDFWSGSYPGTSKYGKYSAKDLSEAYEKANAGKFAAPTLGYADASWDVLFDAVERAGSIEPAKLAEALKATDMDTVVGHVKFGPNHASIQPLAGWQWHYDAAAKTWHHDTVFNAVFPAVKTTGALTLYQAK